MSFVFRTTPEGKIVIPASIFNQQLVESSKCAFIKCFLALPQQKYKLVHTFATKTALSYPQEWIELTNSAMDGVVIDSQSNTKLFLKLKFFQSAENNTMCGERVLSGTYDIEYSIQQVLDTLARSRCLRKLLVCN
jgi:hypothetical protein